MSDVQRDRWPPGHIGNFLDAITTEDTPEYEAFRFIMFVNAWCGMIHGQAWAVEIL